MAVKKRFPYRAALVACNGGCRAVKGEKGCTDGCIGCGDCVQACKFGAIFLMNMVWQKWMRRNVLPVGNVQKSVRRRSFTFMSVQTILL